MSSSSIEKNKLENIDLVQMEYFSDLPLSNKDIIVIEPNNSIALSIRKILKDIGFDNVFSCSEPNEGIRIFVEFIANQISVPIIIDDNLQTRNLKNIIKEILEIQPSAKITIITAREKTDNHIIELFDIGIVSIIQKPLNLAELKKALLHISEKNKEVKKVDSIEDNTETILTISKIISENKIKQIFNTEQSKVETWLKKAKENQRISPYKEVLEATCNQCSSPDILYSSKCPSCKQTNIKQEVLVEHYRCGEVYQKEPGSNICPKCNKNIGSVGKDYLESTDYYVCKSCNDKFPRPFFELICLNCGNVFVENTILWKKDTLYHIKQ